MSPGGVGRGEIRGQRTGKRYRIGDPLAVQVAAVSLAARQLNLVPAPPKEKVPPPKPKKPRRK